MEFVNENGKPVDYKRFEAREIQLIKKYIKSDDRVLELGARYGGSSVAINQILNDKTKQYSVEPDSRVWEALEKNRDNHNCKFNIIKGVISRKPQKIVRDTRQFSDKNDWAAYTVEGREIQNYCLPLCNFNVLVADCEGFMETFYDENTQLFDDLRLIIFEQDRPDNCNYDRLKKIFIDMGFECVVDGFHTVFVKTEKPNFDIPILYINLDSRTDRREHMERLLDGYNYERVPAVYDEHGYIGCAKSHIKCMEIVAERGYDRCIILEDDFVFIGDNNFNSIKIPDFDFDILLICNHIKKYKIIDKDFNRVEWATWTSGYMVNKTIVEDLRYNLIEGIEGLTECYKNKGELYNIKTVGRKNKTVRTLNKDIRKYYLDWYWNQLFDKYMAVGLNNTIASQLNDYSDIQNRVENRYLVNKSVD